MCSKVKKGVLVEDIGWLSFFTEPWTMMLATWTLKQIVSALMQIGVVSYVIMFACAMWLDRL